MSDEVLGRMDVLFLTGVDERMGGFEISVEDRFISALCILAALRLSVGDRHDPSICASWGLISGADLQRQPVTKPDFFAHSMPEQNIHCFSMG
jgi:hypothetical protein